MADVAGLSGTQRDSARLALARIRKPLLYPSELRGQASDPESYPMRQRSEGYLC